jgi:hypothetical protein
MVRCGCRTVGELVACSTGILVLNGGYLEARSYEFLNFGIGLLVICCTSVIERLQHHTLQHRNKGVRTCMHFSSEVFCVRMLRVWY